MCFIIGFSNEDSFGKPFCVDGDIDVICALLDGMVEVGEEAED